MLWPSSRVGIAALGCSVALASLVGIGQAEETVSVYSFQHWPSDPDLNAPLLPYRTFDPALGTLDEVRVLIDTSFVAGVMVLTLGAPEPFTFSTELRLDPEPGRGFTFPGAGPTFLFDGVGPFPPQPLAFERSFTYEFTCTAATDASELCPLQVLGSDGFPPAIAARRDHFVRVGAGALESVEMNMDYADLPGLVVPYSPPGLHFHGGAVFVGYTYTPPGGAANLVPDGGSETCPCEIQNCPLSPWTSTGQGSGRITEYPVGSGNCVLELTAGSPAVISQSVDTPAQSFRVSFDYTYLDAAGSLGLSLAGTLLDAVAPSAGVPGDFGVRRLTIVDPALRGRAGVALEFSFDGNPGSQALIDNVALVPLPEPGRGILLGASLFAVAGLAALRRRRDPRRPPPIRTSFGQRSSCSPGATESRPAESIAEVISRVWQRDSR